MNRCGHPAERRRNTTPMTSDVKGAHRIGEHDVGVRIEASRKLDSLMVEVRLDGEAAVPQRVLSRLRLPAEPPLEFLIAAVGQVRKASSKAEAAMRSLPGAAS